MELCFECDKPANSTRWRGLCEEHGKQMDKDIAAADERYNRPPCFECGAHTIAEAETLCICGGDKDSCHGTHLWPE